ncbi:SigB/SigF/SigG family RNA polymerase sigma factor [Streptomyces ochraceiscleroticus]|uniref:SigB/SigF/SigG family RNA polymerase sigma factor n=1 Tax=Streptomyces ochraceiscleroticus TaxID=47761 RepID=A0ABW1MLR3_9ACTN
MKRQRRAAKAAAPAAPGSRGRHPHDDAPDTTEDFRRLVTLPDGPERQELRGRVISAWLPMAERLALRFRNRGENLEDLQQVAAVGLVKAVDRYDPAHGNAFESFAVPTVVGEIKRHFRDHMWGVHVPRRVQELRNRVRAARQELTSSIDEQGPTPEQVAEHTGMPVEDVLLGSQALNSFSPLSLDAELQNSDDGCSLADTLGTPEAGFDLVLARETVKPHLDRLPEREKKILYLRFFRDMTQSRIAEHLGLSQMHVSRIISRTCRQIADRIGEPRPERTAA